MDVQDELKKQSYYQSAEYRRYRHQDDPIFLDIGPEHSINGILLASEIGVMLIVAGLIGLMIYWIAR